MPKPQILVASPTPVFPPNDGGRIHTFRHLDVLQDEVDYHLLAMVTPTERRTWDEAHDDFFRSVTLVDRPPLMTDMAAGEAWGHFWSHVRAGLPLISVSYYSPEAVRAATAIIAMHNIDLVEVLNTHMAFIRRFIPDVPSILISQNIEGDLHPFWAGKRGIPERVMWKALSGLSSRTTRRVELGNKFGFAERLYITPTDAARAQPPNDVLGVITPIDHEPRLFSNNHLDVLTIGTFDWPPNAAGVRWLLNEVWPRVTAPSAKLNIVGSNPPDDVLAYTDERVAVHGHVEDAPLWRREADALAAPILSGGGARVKIVEALGAGLPVVTTTKGAEGLSLVDGETALIADGAVQFAAAIDRLASSLKRRQHLSGQGMRFAAEHHSADAARAVKVAAYERVLGRPLDSPQA